LLFPEGTFQEAIVRPGFILPLVLAFGLAAPASAQNPPTVAVLDFEASTVTLEDASAVGRSLAAMIATELAGRPQVRVIERDEVERLIQQRQIVLSGRGGDEAALQLGQMLGAQYVVAGNVFLEARRARIDIRILDVETGAIAHATKRTGRRDEFLSIVEALATEFTRDLRDLPPRAAAVASIPVHATLAYSRGLDYEKRGQPDRAREMFARALELHPQHTGAAEAMARLRGPGGRR
jgi:TolB-like protein